MKLNNLKLKILMIIIEQQEKDLILILNLKSYHKKLLFNCKLMMKVALKLGNLFVKYQEAISKRFIKDLTLA